MNVASIGAIGTGFSWPAAIAAGPLSASTLDRLVLAIGDTRDMTQLLAVLGNAGLPASTQVQLSQAAQAMLSVDDPGSTASFGELAQALIIALLLELLAPGGQSA
jgi:hypothetical protein